MHLIKQSALYVSLEPCSHSGKTPPCTDLIIKNKIPEVIIGCKDVYGEFNGRGIEKLQKAGIKVITGVLENECLALNKRFFIFHTHQRPYIILKWAESNNGYISSLVTGGGNNCAVRTLISNGYTNHVVHKWRSEEAAILVGTNTALADDPSLTTRLWKGNNPVRLVIDMELRLPYHLKIFNKAVKTIIFNKMKSEEDENLIFYKIEEKNILIQILKTLHQMQIQSVIVEGGAKLLQSFIDVSLWDEVRIIRNKQLTIAKGLNAPKLQEVVLRKQEQYFNDTISYFLPSS